MRCTLSCLFYQWRSHLSWEFVTVRHQSVAAKTIKGSLLYHVVKFNEPWTACSHSDKATAFYSPSFGQGSRASWGMVHMYDEDFQLGWNSCAVVPWFLNSDLTECLIYYTYWAIWGLSVMLPFGFALVPTTSSFLISETAFGTFRLIRCPWNDYIRHTICHVKY